MAWPPPLPPATRTDTTPQQSNHPDDHVVIAEALADIIAVETGFDGDVAWTRAGNVVTLSFAVGGQPGKEIGRLPGELLPSATLYFQGQVRNSTGYVISDLGCRVISPIGAVFIDVTTGATTPAGGSMNGSFSYVIGAGTG